MYVHGNIVIISAYLQHKTLLLGSTVVGAISALAPLTSFSLHFPIVVVVSILIYGNLMLSNVSNFLLNGNESTGINETRNQSLHTMIEENGERISFEKVFAVNRSAYAFSR